MINERLNQAMSLQEFLVFDDPLCVSVCHLNVIPTKVYIPDLRYLFKDPLRRSALKHDSCGTQAYPKQVS